MDLLANIIRQVTKNEASEVREYSFVGHVVSPHQVYFCFNKGQ